MTNPEPNGPVRSADRWGIILSGDNGTQLRDWLYHRRADYLSKQYLNFIGTRSMLEHTLHRAEKLIPAQKLFLVIAKGHLQYDEVRRQTASRPQSWGSNAEVGESGVRDRGPYILMGHPLYAGNFLIAAGVAVVYNNPAAYFLLVLPFAITYTVIARKRRALHFGIIAG